MNRLQKRCIIGTAGIHLLLLLVLIVGPAFFNSEPKTDNTQVLDVIPANLVDAAIDTGVQNAQPPPPAPMAVPQPPQPVTPTTPAPQISQPPAPVPSPETLTEKLEALFRSLPPTPTPEVTQPKPAPSHPENIKINLQKVTRTTAQNASHTDNAQTRREIDNTLTSLSHNLSSSTKVDVPGTSDAAMASYASVIKSVYERMLLTMLPDQVARDNENAKVRVVIASDGTVISSEIISPSGDPTWDTVVQRTLDQVTFVAPFPDGVTEKQRSYTINFNPQVERQLQ